MIVLVRGLLAPAVAVLALLAASGGVSPAAAQAGTGPPCRNPAVAPTVEEARLTRALGTDPVPVPTRILRASGFDRTAAGFERALCRAGSAAQAGAVVDRWGLRVWEQAARRARAAALPGGDDRPLYWTRLTMTLTLRQWAPSFPLGTAGRARLERRLEYASRGITSARFAARPGVRTMLVSGFDPFFLDTEIRRGNPSGAAVLPLDGRTLTVRGARVQVQAVVFPVRFGDFDRGMVEDAFGPALAPGGRRVDLFATISQGRVGAFDLEVWNGRRRSAMAPDNLNLLSGGTPAAPLVPPGLRPGPEFTAGTLPHQRMLAADGSPFTVRRNPRVVEIPAGGTGPVARPDGPTAGSIAVEGSGGGYLSNEVAYRSTLLRDAAAADVPGGHVHTPVLAMDPANTTAISDPVFERNRADIVRQTEQILRLAAGG